MASEATPLVLHSAPSTMDFAKRQSPTLTKLLGSLQAVLVFFFLFGTTYNSRDYSAGEYVIFRDIMLLLGFGFLMTFLGHYGLGAVGLTMMLTALAVQLNVFVELGCRYLAGDEDAAFPLPLDVPVFIDGEFSAATLLISLFLCWAWVGAEDVGGSMTIHMFGAYFGLAVSKALGPPKPSTVSNADPTPVSDVVAIIGTTLLWVYWPSFVGATESGVPLNENVCVIHTVLALLGSTGAAFYTSQELCHGKFDPVHIANSTLAGGVAVGSAARLNMTPGGALLLGVLAGVVSVYGYVYSTPMLEKTMGVHDTCGVGNLHGWPSLLGGLASVVFVALDSDAKFLQYGAFSQCVRQVLGVVCTMVIAIASGLLTGTVMSNMADGVPDEYDDGAWWEGEYFEKPEE